MPHSSHAHPFKTFLASDLGVVLVGNRHGQLAQTWISAKGNLKAMCMTNKPHRLPPPVLYLAPLAVKYADYAACRAKV